MYFIVWDDSLFLAFVLIIPLRALGVLCFGSNKYWGWKDECPLDRKLTWKSQNLGGKKTSSFQMVESIFRKMSRFETVMVTIPMGGFVRSQSFAFMTSLVIVFRTIYFKKPFYWNLLTFTRKKILFDKIGSQLVEHSFVLWMHHESKY